MLPGIKVPTKIFVLLVVSILTLALGASTVQAQPATFDTPLTEYAWFTGNVRAVAGGVSLYNPPVTGSTYTVNVPVCAGSVTPTITGAYANYYTRYRSSPARPTICSRTFTRNGLSSLTGRSPLDANRVKRLLE